MAEDLLRMTAAVDDRASGPLVNIAKNLANIRTPPALTIISTQLERIDMSARKVATGGWSMMTSVMGLGTLGGVSAALAGIAAGVNKLAQGAGPLRQLARETGLTIDALRTLRDVGEHMSIPTDKIDSAISNFAGKLVEFRRNYGQLYNDLRTGVGMPGVAEQLRAAGDDFEKQVGIALGALKSVKGKNAADTEQLRKQWAEKFFGDPALGALFTEPGKFERILGEARKRVAETPAAELDKQAKALAEEQKKFADQTDKFMREIAPNLLAAGTKLLQAAEVFSEAGKALRRWTDSLGITSKSSFGGGIEEPGSLRNLIHRAAFGTSGASGGILSGSGTGAFGGVSPGGGFSGGGRVSGGGARAPLPAAGPGTGIGHVASQAEREAFIRAEAKKRGIDPDIAMRIARSEGFGKYVGDRGRSFGDWQLFTGGGLGNEALKAGIDVRDPRTWREQTRFALDRAARDRSWGPWYGRGPARVGLREGFGPNTRPLGWQLSDDERQAASAGPAREGQTVAEAMVDNFRRFTSGFGARRNPFTGRAQTHAGVDMSAPLGSLFRARQAGRIESISPSGDIAVRYSDGTLGRYLHGVPGVSVGDEVTAGQALGRLRAGRGAPGGDPRSTGPHLHYEAYDARGNVFDPMPLLRERLSKRESDKPAPLVGNWPEAWRPSSSFKPPGEDKPQRLDGSVHLNIDVNGGGANVKVRNMDGIVRGSTIRRTKQLPEESWV